jgi:mono/diheme cytochrome c family protein
VKRLVASLEHREAWWRDTAQRLLVERRDPDAIAPLRKLARDSRHSLARLHAMWALDGMNAVDWPTVQAALSDPDVDVAVAAARLSEGFFEKEAARTLDALNARAAWGEPKFLRQLALSLGAGPANVVDAVLTRLASEHGGQPYIADAIVSSLHGREAAAIGWLAKSGNPRAGKVVASLAAAILQSKDSGRIDALLARLNDDEIEPWMAEGIMAGVDRFIPGSKDRRRTAFLPAEPRALIELSRHSTPLGARAAEALRYLRWQGRAVDQSAVLASLDPTQRARYELGKKEFAVCAACHQPGGEGMAGLAPPLVASTWATGGVAALARIVLNGKTSADSTMPPLAALDDETLAAILTYIRKSWGHEASAVAPAEIQAIRAEVSNRSEPWTESELAPMN